MHIALIFLALLCSVAKGSNDPLESLRVCSKTKDEWRELALKNTEHAQTLVHMLRKQQESHHQLILYAGVGLAAGSIPNLGWAYSIYRASKNFQWHLARPGIFALIASAACLGYWYKERHNHPNLDCSKIEALLKGNNNEKAPLSSNSNIRPAAPTS